MEKYFNDEYQVILLKCKPHEYTAKIKQDDLIPVHHIQYVIKCIVYQYTNQTNDITTLISIMWCVVHDIVVCAQTTPSHLIQAQDWGLMTTPSHLIWVQDWLMTTPSHLVTGTNDHALSLDLGTRLG